MSHYKLLLNVWSCQLQKSSPEALIRYITLQIGGCHGNMACVCHGKTDWYKKVSVFLNLCVMPAPVLQYRCVILHCIHIWGSYISTR